MDCTKKSGASQRSNSYTPKKNTATRNSNQQAKAMKGWAGAGSFGTPKVGRVSFGKR